MKSMLIEMHYLPSIAYFNLVSRHDTLIIERHEHFIKQSYRNRCYINTAQGKELLSVPVRSADGKVFITEVRIDYSHKWLNNHWRAFQSAYGKAAFFEYYADQLHQTLFQKYNFLYDLNYNLLSLCLKWLKLEKVIQESMSYEDTHVSGVKDYRNVINAKNNEERNKYNEGERYHQVFGNMFVNNLSILDVVFCAGPQANQIIKASFFVE